MKKILQFPVPFLKAYPPVWIAIFFVLIGADLASKKAITNEMNFGLSQSQRIEAGVFSASGTPAETDQTNYVSILGDNGKYIRLRLVFNDRFLFGSGPSAPVLGIFLTAAAILFLFFYRWKTYGAGHPLAWLFVFSGAVGNLIDKLFIKSLTTREWVLSFGPQKGHVSGVVDFVECIWFGLHQFDDVWPLKWLSWDTWPIFNLADSLIVVGICILVITIGLSPDPAKETTAEKADV
ncbi:MAG: signal peptidase II [Leptospiraceae bacterium]|nr:signal peptidase II [Leptospiraceae bacterium]